MSSFPHLDFLARLAALVPKPRVNLTRFHGVFAPGAKHRAWVTPAKRGKGRKTKAFDEPEDRTPAERRAAMTWAQRLKRVFNIGRSSAIAPGIALDNCSCIVLPSPIHGLVPPASVQSCASLRLRH